jgi:hypothetical protein
LWGGGWWLIRRGMDILGGVSFTDCCILI